MTSTDEHINIPIDAILKTERMWDPVLNESSLVTIKETRIAKYRKRSRLRCLPKFSKSIKQQNKRAVLWNFYIPGTVSIFLSLAVLYLVLMFGFKSEQIVTVAKHELYFRTADSPNGLKHKGDIMDQDEISVFKNCEHLRVSIDPNMFYYQYCRGKLCDADTGIVSHTTTQLCRSWPEISGIHQRKEGVAKVDKINSNII